MKRLFDVAPVNLKHFFPPSVKLWKWTGARVVIITFSVTHIENLNWLRGDEINDSVWTANLNLNIAVSWLVSFFQNIKWKKKCSRLCSGWLDEVLGRCRPKGWATIHKKILSELVGIRPISLKNITYSYDLQWNWYMPLKGLRLLT